MSSTTISSRGMLMLSSCRPVIVLVQSAYAYYAAQKEITKEHRELASQRRYSQIFAGPPHLDYWGNPKPH